MLSCKQVTELVSQSHDRRLSFRERVAIRIHLFACDMCTRYTKHLGFIVKAIRKYLRDPDASRAPNTKLSESARERINKIIDGG